MAFQFNSIPKALCCGHLQAHLLLKLYENSVVKMGQEPQGKGVFSKDQPSERSTEGQQEEQDQP